MPCYKATLSLEVGMRGLRGGFLSSVTRPVSLFALRPWQQGRDHEGDRVYFATCFVLLRTWGGCGRSKSSHLRFRSCVGLECVLKNSVKWDELKASLRG